jgi:hypothetical protein
MNCGTSSSGLVLGTCPLRSSIVSLCVGWDCVNRLLRSPLVWCNEQKCLQVDMLMSKKKKLPILVWEFRCLHVHLGEIKWDVPFWERYARIARTAIAHNIFLVLVLLCYIFWLVHTTVFRQKDVKRTPDDGRVYGPQQYEKNVVIGGCFSYTWYSSFGW